MHIGGPLAIVEYVRHKKASVAAQTAAEFLNRYGEPRAYTRLDYVAELSELEGFGSVETWRQQVALPLSPTEFAGLALSSSHARQVIKTLGWTAAEAMIRTIGADLAGGDGNISFGYLFQALAAARLPSSKS